MWGGCGEREREFVCVCMVRWLCYWFANEKQVKYGMGHGLHTHSLSHTCDSMSAKTTTAPHKQEYFSTSFLLMFSPCSTIAQKLSNVCNLTNDINNRTKLGPFLRSYMSTDRVGIIFRTRFGCAVVITLSGTERVHFPHFTTCHDKEQREFSFLS